MTTMATETPTTPMRAAPRRRRLAGWGVALRIARRETLRAKGRSALVVFLIMLPVLVVTAASTLLRTADVSTVEALPRELGTADAAIAPPWLSSEDDRGGILQCPDGSCAVSAGGPAATVSTLAEAEDFIRSTLGPQARVVAMPAMDIGVTVGDRSLSLRATEADLADPLLAPIAALTEGRLPQRPGEVTVTQPLAEAGATIGSTLDLRTFGDATVVGVVRSARTPYEAFAAPGGLGLPMRQESGFSGASQWLVGVPGGVSWAQMRALNAQRMTVTSRAVITDPPSRAELLADPATAPLVDMMAVNGSNQMPAVLGLLVAMIVLEVVLLAGPAFAVGAAQQTRALGLLAAQGGTRRQLRRVVLGQSVVLGGLAAVGGVLLGLLAAGVLALVLPRFMASAAEMGPFDVGWLDVALVATLGFASAVIAALAPARAVARLDPVRAMAGRRPQPRRTRLHPVLGLGLVALGLALAGAGAAQSRPRSTWQAESDGDGSLLIAAGAVAAVLGVVLIAPLAVRLLARLAGRAPLAGRYALRDMARNQLRTAPAVAAVAGVVAGTVALGIATTSDSAQSQAMFTPSGPMGAGVVRLYASELAPADVQRVWASMAEGLARKYPQGTVTPIATAPDPYEFMEPRDTLMLTDATVLPPDAAGVFEPGTVGAAQQGLAGMGVPRYGSGLLVGPAGLAGIADLLTPEQQQRATRALAAGAAVVLRNTPATADEGTAQFDRTRVDPTAEDAEGLPRLESFRVPAIALQVPGVGVPAAAVIPEALAARAGVTPVTSALLVAGPAPLTQADQERLQFVIDHDPAVVAAGVGGYASVVTGWTNDLRMIQLVLFAAAAVLVLAGSLTAALLALSDARADFATLGAVGAAPRLRRRISGAYGWAIAFIGAVLGATVGFIPGVAITYPLTTDQWTPAMIGRVALTGEPITDHYLVIPWPMIATLVIALPILIALIVALTTRSRLPMVARIE